MDQKLETLRSSISDQTETVERFFSTMSGSAVSARPAKDSWSIAEHVEHLSIVNELYIQRIGEAIERARAAGRGAGRGYRDGRLAEWLIRSMEPPPTRRLSAFRKTKPALELEPARVLDRFRAAQGECDAQLRSTDGVDLGAGQLRSPLFGLVKLTILQGFRLIDTHNRRHIWHIEKASVAGSAEASDP